MAEFPRLVPGGIAFCCCPSNNDCPAPACSNCTGTPGCPPRFQIGAENLQVDTRWDITTGNWPQLLNDNVTGGCVGLAIFGFAGVPPSQTFNYANAADLAAQIEGWLAGLYGGNWTVSASDTANGVIISGLTGMNSLFPFQPGGSYDFAFEECDETPIFDSPVVAGVETQNCAVLLADHPIAQTGGVGVLPNGACEYTYTEQLGGSCNLTMDVTVQMLADRIAATVTLTDGNGVVQSVVSYETDVLPPSYLCDVVHGMSVVGFSDALAIDWGASAAQWDGTP